MAIWHWIGYCVCHQMPDRTLVVGGRMLPVCARCSGMYLGFVLALLLQLAGNRGRFRIGVPPVWVAVIAALGMGVMAFDGVSSYAGWRTTTNDIRLVTGSLTGAAVAVVLPALVGYALCSESNLRGRRLWAPLYLVVLWLPAVVLPWILPRMPDWLGWLGPVAVSLGILAMWTMVNSAMFGVLLRSEPRGRRALGNPAVVGLSLCAAIAELTFAHWLHYAMYHAIGLA